MIETKDLVKTFGPTNAVAGVSFKIEAGEVVGLLGVNGAGKTTTIRILCTYLAPTSGQAWMAGFDVSKDPLEVRRRLGYLPENAPLYEEMRVKDYLSFIMQVRGIEPAGRPSALDRIVHSTGISTVLKKSVGELSKGYRQRVGLAQAMVHDPEILILDEPTSGLDPNQIVEIRNLIREIGKKKTIILSTHILAEVEAACDRVIIIHKGRKAADGKIRDLRRSGAREGVLRVGSRGEKAKVMEMLRGVQGVCSVEPLESEGNGRAPLYHVKSEGGGDVGEAVFEAAGRAGLVLSEITPLRRTLENIFQDLTKEQ